MGCTIEGQYISCRKCVYRYDCEASDVGNAVEDAPSDEWEARFGG